jgi:hypothetical protein
VRGGSSLAVTLARRSPFAATAVVALAGVVVVAAPPAKGRAVRVSLESEAGTSVLWVHRPATMRVLLRGPWPAVSRLAWVLEIEGKKRGSGEIPVEPPGQPPREFEQEFVISDEDYRAGRTMAAPKWLDAEHNPSDTPDDGRKSNRRRLLVQLSVRDGGTNQLLGKGQTDVTIEPPPQNGR